jgi:hypothetical protein
VLADLFPVSVIAVLQPSRGIETDGLQMRRRIGRIADVAIGRRHRHRVQAADGADVTDRGSVGANEGIALAALDAADGQPVLVTERQPVFTGQRFDGGFGCNRLGDERLRCRLDGFLDGFLGQLPERFRQCNGRIGGNGPRSLETLLIHHGRCRLAPPVCRQCLLLWLGSGGPSGPGEAI